MKRLELTESSRDNALAYAKWFGSMWGAVSTVMFLLAFWRTYALTHVYSVDPPPQPIGVLGSYGADGAAVASVTFQQLGAGKSQWLIDVPDGTMRVLIPSAQNMQCIQSGKTVDEVFAGTAPAVSFRKNPVEYAIRAVEKASVPYGQSSIVVDALSAGPAEGATDTAFVKVAEMTGRQNGLHFLPLPAMYVAAHITCSSHAALPYTTRPPVANDSYAGREIAFHAEVFPPGVHAARLTVSAHAEDAQNMQVDGGVEQSVATTLLEPGQDATIKYDDAVAVNKRDEGFVLVGALIALGAAAFLEALRPFIEWFIGERLNA